MSESASPLAELAEYARTYADPEFSVHDVAVRLDEDQEGELVSRVLLLLTDPTADTWRVEAIRDLRLALGRKATALGLPRVSLTLVPESEAEAVEPFARR